MTKVKLKFSSSSLLRRRRKVGDIPVGSGSYIRLRGKPGQQKGPHGKWRTGHECTCMNSTTLSSPMSRFAITLVLGNEFGATLSNVRRRELVIDSEARDTAEVEPVKTE